MRISDWSSDVCSSDLSPAVRCAPTPYACHPNRTPRRPFLGPSSMTLTQLRYLVAIADSGLNITLAAERVHATQPGLSKQIKQPEDELGFQLFMRKGRNLEAHGRTSCREREGPDV